MANSLGKGRTYFDWCYCLVQRAVANPLGVPVDELDLRPVVIKQDLVRLKGIQLKGVKRKKRGTRRSLMTGT